MNRDGDGRRVKRVRGKSAGSVQRLEQKGRDSLYASASVQNDRTPSSI